MDGSDEMCVLTSEGVWELKDPNIRIDEAGAGMGGYTSFVKPHPDSIDAKIDPDKECAEDEFKCTTSGECIPISKRCDGETADCKVLHDTSGICLG